MNVFATVLPRAARTALPVSTTSQKYLSWRRFIFIECISRIE